MFMNIWRNIGTLYFDNESEEQAIRQQCESWCDVPMGYGRMPRAPVQLSDSEARAQWRNER